MATENRLSFHNPHNGQTVSVVVDESGMVDVEEAIKDLTPAMQAYFKAVLARHDEEADDGVHDAG